MLCVLAGRSKLCFGVLLLCGFALWEGLGSWRIPPHSVSGLPTVAVPVSRPCIIHHLPVVVECGWVALGRLQLESDLGLVSV